MLYVAVKECRIAGWNCWPCWSSVKLMDSGSSELDKEPGSIGCGRQLVVVNKQKLSLTLDEWVTINGGNGEGCDLHKR